MKLIDVSSNQGSINWTKVSQIPDMKGAILRTTLKNGSFDSKLLANVTGIASNINDHFGYCGFYKFAYTRNYLDAYLEAMTTLTKIEKAGVLGCCHRFYLDLEGWGGRDYTTREASEVIKGYGEAAAEMAIPFGLYANQNYILRIIDPIWSKRLYLWMARYSKTMGNTGEWEPKIWQYSSKGKVDGISGNVDMNEVITII